VGGAKMQVDTIKFAARDKWLVMDLYRFLHAMNIFYNRLYVFDSYVKEGYKSLKEILMYSLYYVADGDELSVESLIMKSPAEFNFKGVGEAIREIREYIKDHKFRNRQEKEFGEIELMRRRILLMKEAGFTDEEIKKVIGIYLTAAKKINTQIDENRIELIEDKPEEKTDE
jgi:hypothetical protein